MGFEIGLSIKEDDASVASSVPFQDDDAMMIHKSSPQTSPIAAYGSDDHTEESSQDAPEALVRKDNRTVGVVRIVVILVLFGAAIATSIFIYLFTRNSQLDSFQSEFNGVAAKLVSSMTNDVSLKFWIGRTLSNAITMAMRNTGRSHVNLTMPADLWDQMTQEARFNANIMFVSWSPRLESEQERQDFEAFAATQEFKTGANPACFLCGDERRGYSNPNDLVELPGFGIFRCWDLEITGRRGVIPEENCFPIAQALSQTCVCEDLPPDVEVPTNVVTVPEKVFRVTAEDGMVPEPTGRAPYHAMWQAAVLDVKKLPLMYNELSEPVRSTALEQMMAAATPVMTETYSRTGPFYQEFAGENSMLNGVVLYYPVFGSEGNKVVGSVTMEIVWESFLSVVFPPLSDKIDLVVENSCGQNLTFRVDLPRDRLNLVGEGDLHDPNFSDMVHSSTYEKYEQIVDLAAPVNQNQTALDYCRYRFHVFATKTFEDSHVNNEPYLYAIIAAAIFFFTSLVFVVYDVVVWRRQRTVMGAANRTNAIVADLFPREVRHRLYERARNETKNGSWHGLLATPTKTKMQNFLSDDDDETARGGPLATEPLADFFPRATIMFLDIAGFTAWSSEREPAQVFRLLETVYQSFDEVARTLGVFKVETIGDSYVAVCGLPTPREHHAVIMAQFAAICLKRMLRLTRELEKYLGPSTGELRARVGLHSGPVTAGVLRGEKARFQLFGDTVNTAARLESTGGPHRVQASKETVELLRASGKGSWIQPRKELVHIKGKGDLQTYWVTPGRKSRLSGVSSTKSTSSQSLSHAFPEEDDELDPDVLSSLPPGVVQTRAMNMRKKNMRLVDWNVEVLFSLLENIVGCRAASEGNRGLASIQDAELQLKRQSDGKIVIEEMTQILCLPEFDENRRSKHSPAAIPPLVKEQLHDFVTQISNLYRDVPFHNFDHASHVIMSAGKLMKRIVNPDGVDFESAQVEDARNIHDRTYGICSDKLMQFAVVFSALIHDVDHTGLTNAELNKMDAPVSSVYRQKSVAEQNSVDVAWTVLMDDRFKELRACIYTNEEELRRFRELIVNAVMATDIADKQLKTLRENRWDDAFSEQALSEHSQHTATKETAPAPDINNMNHLDADRKATIVFEYIIQASDVAHTMQHWHTYQKFNRRLFEERYLAWMNGHGGEDDPSLGWYKGELWFFDNYIIPLARKLDKCGVFGVSYDEYLNYAKENRKEWEVKGEGIVAEMLESCRSKYREHFGDGESWLA